jgi:hypothetical protein
MTKERQPSWKPPLNCRTTASDRTYSKGHRCKYYNTKEGISYSWNIEFEFMI